MVRPTALNKKYSPRGGLLISAVLVMLIVIMALLPDIALADAGPIAAPLSSTPSIEGMEIRARLSSADLQVAGVRLNRWLVWRLYAAYGFEPIWASRQREAVALQNAVLRADEHGLNQICFMRR